MNPPPSAAASIASIEAAQTSSADPCGITSVVCRFQMSAILSPYVRFVSASSQSPMGSGSPPSMWGNI